MPDAAFVDTEAQFRRAVAPAELALYTITEIPRSEATTAVIEKRYSGLDRLWSGPPPDALIVTGTEPAQAQLSYEPYWPYLARLLQWAATSVPTAMLSCLAAHASILLFDGIERVARPVKLSGVFPSRVAVPGHPLADGLPAVSPVPHSRLNDVPEAALRAAGYAIVLSCVDPEAGWSVAARRQDRSLFVLCQGHPEYSAVSLLREYRRDVRRSLFGRGAVPYPAIPEGYLSAQATGLVTGFAARASVAGADPLSVWRTFPFDQIAPELTRTWAAPSATLYGNWLRLARTAPPAADAARS
jgi:homoserine O-succinyltransferase